MRWYIPYFTHRNMWRQELGFFEEEGLDVTVSVGNRTDKSMTTCSPIRQTLPFWVPKPGSMSATKAKKAYTSFAQLTQKAGNFLVSAPAFSGLPVD